MDVQFEVRAQLKEHPRACKLFHCYHYRQDVKDRYNQYINVHLRPGLFTAEELRQIQNLILDYLAKKNIALEVPITSNLCISFYRKHSVSMFVSNQQR